MIIKRFRGFFKHKRFCHIYAIYISQALHYKLKSQLVGYKKRGKCVGTFSAILVYSDLVGNLGYRESLNEREIASVQRETNYNCDYANELWLFMSAEKTHSEEQNIL